VFGVNPVRLLTNTPVPVPSEVRLSAVVGFGNVLQQTPLAVTVTPPFAVTLPPPVAVVCAMSTTSDVDTVGIVETLAYARHRRGKPQALS
jgi:hypothetical protein